MEWDLYLDESGKFKNPGEPTIVGGFLLPHANNPEMSEFSRWEEALRDAVCQAGLLTPEEIQKGDEWHFLCQKNKSAKEQRPENCYVFSHCSENHGYPGRSKVQPWILGEYLKKIKERDGKTILFENPEGAYYVDSNTTFMSVFANGIVRLYNDLRNGDPDERTVLYIHAAARVNITQRDEKDKLKTSPMAGNGSYNLNRELYLNQIRNNVFLNGGSDLLELDSFRQSLESFEILNDRKINGERYPNPATVVCDYICNSALARERNKMYDNQFSQCEMLDYNVFGQEMKLAEAQTELMIQNNDWFSYLKILISRGFPEHETQAFFEKLNKVKNYNQQKCVNELVDYLYPFVENRVNMKGIIDRLQLIIDQCTPLRKDAYNFLQANLLIYLFALYTHIGNENKLHETEKRFVACLFEIRDYNIRDELLVLFCNRRIVADTDAFRYEDAASWFEVIENHIRKAIECSDELMISFAALIDKYECLNSAVSVQYGKAIGSYLQLLTKKIRVSAADEYEKNKTEAERLIQTAFEYFTLPADISRCHQNICDLKTELAEYDEALSHLCKSVGADHTGLFAEQAEAVLKHTGSFGEKMMFVYLHYVYLTHRCFRSGDPEILKKAQKMIQAVIKKGITMEMTEHLFQNAYPGAVTAWHLGASLLYAGGCQRVGQEILENAANLLLSSGSEVIGSIGMAAKAELISLGLDGKLADGLDKWEKKAVDYLQQVYPRYMEETVNNPFNTVVNTQNFQTDAQLFHRIADRVAY